MSESAIQMKSPAAGEAVVISPCPSRRRSFVLETELLVPRPIDEVFAFFADARNLERITPPFLKFSVLTPPPIHLAAGTLIDYRLRVRGLPLRWRSEITVWDPPHRFVDEQRRGPYYYWHHEHKFEAVASGTLVRDEVTYQTPGGAIINACFVAPDLRKVFEYRRTVLKSTLAAIADSQPAE